MIELKFLADDGYMCVGEKDVHKLKGGKTYKVYHDNLGLMGKSKIVQIYCEDTDKTYLADTKTGTLYDEKTMRCLTGALYLV